MKRKLSIILASLLIFNLFAVTSFADNAIIGNASITLNQVKNLATKQNKIMNIEAYEADFKNAKTDQEKLAVKNKYDQYVVYTQVVSQPTAKSFSNYTSTLVGDTRLIINYSYGARSNYSNATSSTFIGLSNLALNIGLSFAHPAVGVINSFLGAIIAPSDYGNYTGIIETTLHDYVQISKEAQVWTGSYWQSYAISQQRNTSAQINLVYYEKSVRKTPSNKDLGLIKEEIGDHYTDDAFLKRIAKNLYLSGNSPMVYIYWSGTVNNYNKSYLFRY